jgi:hypothetical protein
LSQRISTAKNNCSKWVQQMLTEEHKSERLGAALTFLEQVLVVTGNVTWVSHIPENKHQSLE